MNSSTTFSLSPAFDELLKRAVDVENPQALARDIIRLSNFYIENPGAPTPWGQAFTASAYLAYFLPLNYVRLQGVLREVHRFLPEFSEVWDFGSGIGATQWALENDLLSPRPLMAVEHASEAVALHRHLISVSTTRWPVTFNSKTAPKPQALAIFSYAFLEMKPQWPALEPFDHVLIIEPSTRDCGRALMEWRARLIEQGYTPLAPCTHALDCPLLSHSHKDWCHNRIHFAGPEWWQALESYLPMHNRTLTYSYLLVSRTTKDEKWRGYARVIGDTLKEKGKTRQMICRGSEREFLSWLHKKGEPPAIPHGALLTGAEQAERHGGELRPSESLTWTT